MSQATTVTDIMFGQCSPDSYTFLSPIQNLEDEIGRNVTCRKEKINAYKMFSESRGIIPHEGTTCI